MHKRKEQDRNACRGSLLFSVIQQTLRVHETARQELETEGEREREREREREANRHGEVYRLERKREKDSYLQLNQLLKLKQVGKGAV